MTFAPTAGTANLAAQVGSLDPVIYLVQYQLPVAVPTLIVIAAAHYFVQRFYDQKNDDVYTDVSAAKAADQPAAPKWYAVFPILPIALLIIFSKLVVASIKLDTVSALFMVWIGVVIIEIIRSRDVKKVFKDGLAMFQSMGKMFAGIVALIICAEFFATGLKVSGLIDILINSAQGVGAGMGAMTVILTAIVSIVTFLTGSGVGAYSSFATLAPDVAAGLGGSVAELVTPMQFASGLLRAMSPVAGVIIAVAGAAGVSPMAMNVASTVTRLPGICNVYVPSPYLDSNDSRHHHSHHRQRNLYRLMNLRPTVCWFKTVGKTLSPQAPAERLLLHLSAGVFHGYRKSDTGSVSASGDPVT